MFLSSIEKPPDPNILPQYLLYFGVRGFIVNKQHVIHHL